MKTYTSIKKIISEYKKSTLLIHNYIWLYINENRENSEKLLKNKKIQLTRKNIIKKLSFIVSLNFIQLNQIN